MGQKQVLLVEDDKSLQAIIEVLLENMGIKVVATSNASKAISYLGSSEQIDLVVTDLNLGRVNGDFIIRRAKKRDGNLPVIAISAYAGEEDNREELRKMGANEILDKPFDTKKFEELVKSYLGMQ